MLDDEGKMNNQDYGRIIFWGDRGYGFILRPMQATATCSCM